MKTIKQVLLIASCCLVLVAASAVHAQSSGAALRTLLETEKLTLVGWFDVAATEVEDLQRLRELGLQIPDGPLEAYAKVQPALKQVGVERILWISDFSIAMQVHVVVPTKHAEAAAVMAEGLVKRAGLVSKSGDGFIAIGTASTVEALAGYPRELVAAADRYAQEQGGDVGLLAVELDTLLPVAVQAFQSAVEVEYGIATEDLQTLASMKSVKLAVDLHEVNASLQAECPAEESARETASVLGKLISTVGLSSDLVAASGKQVSVTLDRQQHAADFQRLMDLAAGSADRVQKSNDLQQVALGMLNFESAHRSYPPQALASSNGQRLLSWRVIILPFINRGELYDQFHLDEPWDSPHNLSLVKKIPSTYAIPGDDTGMTTLLAPLTPNSILGGTEGPSRIQTVTDGTSNTILVVDAPREAAVIWTKPEDLSLSPEKSAAQLYGGRKGFTAAWADSSVRQVPEGVSSKVFNALISKGGGEVVDVDF